MQKNVGFTLIELLVVVLIIGILVAVALPQYQVVVGKVRVATYLPFMRSLQKAQERYYMANGTYATHMQDLDVVCPFYGTTGASEGWCFLDSKGRVRIHMDEGYYFVLEASQQGILLLFFYQGTASCYAAKDSKLANRICKSLTGNDSHGSTSSRNIYSFPMK